MAYKPEVWARTNQNLLHTFNWFAIISVSKSLVETRKQKIKVEQSESYAIC